MLNRSMTKSNNPSRPQTDRSKAKSIDKLNAEQSFIRQIVIRTDEPDIPQITILKVERSRQIPMEGGISSLQRVFERVRLKRLYQGVGQICSHIHFSKLKTFNANRLLYSLRSKQKRLLNFAWIKIMNVKRRYQSKLNTSRLLSKLSMLLLNKTKLYVFNQIKSQAFSRLKRSVTQATEQNAKKMNESFEIQITKVRSQQFSSNFMTFCKKYTKITKNFVQSVINELEPNIVKQIERYIKIRENQGLPVNNQIVLNVIRNHIVVLKDLKNESETNLATIKSYKKQDAEGKLKFYIDAQKQFQKADNEIRQSFGKHNKIQQKELSKIMESQLIIWNRQKSSPLYNSRLFVTAIVAKLIKENNLTLLQFFDRLEAFSRLAADPKKLEQFRKSLNTNDRGSAIILSIANKIIQLSASFGIGMPPIMQRGFSENEQIIMSEIKYIRNQIKEFISLFNNSTQRMKLKKTLSSKRAKAPEQLKQLYGTINELIGMIQSNQNSKKDKQKISDGDKKLQLTMKTLIMFKECLSEGNYRKWQAFINNQIKKQQFSALLDILDKINDILNQKISQESKQTTKQIEKLRKSQAKSKQQAESLKSKANQLQKKNKSLQNSRTKEISSAKDLEQIAQLKKANNQWEKKWNQLQQKYSKLQNVKQKVPSVQKSPLQKVVNELKQKNQQMNKEIIKLKEESKQLRDRSSDKLKNQNQKKALNLQIQNQLKELQGATQKLKQQLQNKNKLISENQTKIKKYEADIKRLQTQSRSKSKQPVQEVNIIQYNQIQTLNESLTKKITQLTHKIEMIAEELELKEGEIKNMRNQLINEQKNQVGLQQIKNQNSTLVRKLNLYENTIQSLKLDLKSKSERIELYELDKKGGKASYKPEKNVEHSLDLIKQLNSQLQKLKKSEITLEEINKELEHVHHRGQDVQQLITRIELENSEFKNLLQRKEKTMGDLEAELNRLRTQFIMVEAQANKMNAELLDRDQSLKRIEASQRDREALIKRELQIKIEYIRKLEGMINANEQNTNELNQKIIKLQNREPEIPTHLKNQTAQLQNTLRQLKASNQARDNWERRANESERKHQSDRKLWQEQSLKWSTDRQRYETEISKWVVEMKKWETEKLKLNGERDKLEIDWKNFTVKYEQITNQNARLMRQLNQLNVTLQNVQNQLYQISNNNSSINLDNIVLLLTNITASFIKIHPHPNESENKKTNQTVFNDLFALKEKYINLENQMFFNFEQYIIQFIANDIGRYRYELSLKINDLNELKQRLIQFLNNEIQIAKKSLSYQYSFEIKQRSTAAKSVYETPAKFDEIGTKVTSQIKEIREKTQYAQRLFESNQDTRKR